MALSDCIATIRAAAPNLSKEQADELLTEVSDILEKLQSDKNVTDLDAALTDAVNKRVSQEERAAINEKRLRALNYKTRLRYIQRLREVPDEEIPDFLESISAGKYGSTIYKSSVERTHRALQRQAFSVFMTGVEKKGLIRGEAISFLRKAQNGEALMRESYAPGTTGNETARILAETMEEVNELLRKQANKHGADIARLPGYLVKQSHDNLKIHRATRDAWVDDIFDLLDHDRTFGRPMTDAAKREYLGNAWETLISGRRDDTVRDLSAAPGFKGPGNLAKQLGHHRSLHFKDGASAWSYMQDYGRPDIGNSFFGGIDLMARSIAAMRHLGPNPKFMLDEIVSRARNRLRGKPDIANRIDENYIDRMYEEVIGAASILPPWQARGWLVARTANWLKNISNSALLGATTLTSVSDIGTSAVRLSEIGIPFLEAHGSVVGGLVRGRRSGEARELADSLAIGVDSLISGVQSRWLGNDGVDGQGANLVSAVMRVTGMNWLNDTMKTSVGLTLANYLARQVGKSFDSLNPSLRQELAGYRITPEEFETLGNAVREVDGKQFVDIDLVTDQDFALKLKEFIGGFADSAVLTPGARTNALIRGGSERGRWDTEIRMLFFHLKSYSIAFTQEILSRAWRNEGSRVAFGLHLIASMTVYGYIANILKDTAAGREPREPGMEAFFDAFMTAGGAGFYGDLIIGAVGREQRYGEGLLEAIGGPVLGTTLRSLKIANELIEGDFDSAAYKGMRTAKSMIPGANIFYARMAMDYMFWWQMSEYLRPGWARNFEERVRDETGQDFYISPTDAVSNSYLN